VDAAPDFGSIHDLLYQNKSPLRLSFPRNDGPRVLLEVNRLKGTGYLLRDFDSN
jgi:hypothetical protein